MREQGVLELLTYLTFLVLQWAQREDSQEACVVHFVQTELNVKDRTFRLLSDTY